MQDAEDNLELEEKKVLSLQLEHGKYKQEVERKMGEKDEEIELARKNLQKQMDGLQQSLEDEMKAKSNLNRQRKSVEEQLAELEANLAGREKELQDSLKTNKKLQAQLKVCVVVWFKLSHLWLHYEYVCPYEGNDSTVRC